MTTYTSVLQKDAEGCASQLPPPGMSRGTSTSRVTLVLVVVCVVITSLLSAYVLYTRVQPTTTQQKPSDIKIIQAKFSFGGEEKVAETIELDEQNKQVKINVGQQEVLVDYKRAMLVLFNGRECGVAPRTKNNTFTLEQVQNMKDGADAEVNPEDVHVLTYKHGEAITDRSVLSQLAQDMCQHKPLHWLVEVTHGKHGRVRRDNSRGGIHISVSSRGGGTVSVGWRWKV